MTFPTILYSTGSPIAAAAGLLTALFLSYKEKSLLVVAVCTCTSTFIVSLLLLMIN